MLKERTGLSARNIVAEPTFLTDSARRPVDILRRNFHGQNKHLVLDVGVTSTLNNTRLQLGAKVPGSAAQAY